MIKLFHFSAIITVLLIGGGCAHVDIPLLQPVRELQEKTVEGEGKAKLLLIEISGFISEKERSGGLGSRPSMVADVRESLQKAEKDKDVTAIILRINSPGGTVSASDIIHHDLKSFSDRTGKPIFACITGIGTSGAYYIASAADEISAHPTAITGSIGVLLMRFNIEGLLSKIGVSEKTEKSVDKKDLLSPFRSATPEEEKIIHEIILSLHHRFVEVVQRRAGSQLTPQDVERLADGRIYTADQALGARLIDSIGYLDDTVSALKEKLGLKEARIVVYQRPGSFQGSIYSSSPSDSPRLGLININADGLEILSGSQFYYLWRP